MEKLESSNFTYRPEIDGLRALAVVPVVLFHAGFGLFSGGYVGVDVFFVISGYLITTLISKDLEDDSFSLVSFYERRARRILPALTFVILCSIPIAWALMLPSQFKNFSQSVAAISLFSSNFLFWIEDGYFDIASEEKPLLHTWSLSVEEQFYIVFPLLLLALWKLRKSASIYVLLALAALSLFLSTIASTLWPSANFFLMPTRAWELLAGAIAALVAMKSRFSNNALALFGFGMVAVSILTFDKNTPMPGPVGLIPVMGVVLILLYGDEKTFLARFLTLKPIVFIGLISYSIYLWHQVIFSLARIWFLKEPDPIWMVLFIVLSIILAAASWKFVEKPFRSLQFGSRRAVFTTTIASSLALVVFGLIVHASDGRILKDYGETFESIVAVRNDNQTNQKCWERISRSATFDNSCTLGENGLFESFAIVGDSHAGSLVQSIDTSATRLGIHGRDYSFGSCPPVEGIQPIVKNEDHRICDGLREDFAKKRDSGVLPETLILAARWTNMLEQNRFDNSEGGIERGGQSFWKSPNAAKVGRIRSLSQAYEESVKRLLSLGHQVVLIYPIPEAGWNVPDRLAQLHLRGEKITPASASTSFAVFQARNKNAYRALDKIGSHNRLIRIYPEKLLCNSIVQHRCVTHLNGLPLYQDDDHLSYLGASIIVEEIAKHMEPAN